MNVYFGRTLQTCTLFPASLIVFVEIRLKSTVFLRVRFRWSLAFAPVNIFVFDEWLLLAIILKICKWELIIEPRQTCAIGSIQIEVIIYIKITRVFYLILALIPVNFVIQITRFHYDVCLLWINLHWVRNFLMVFILTNMTIRTTIPLVREWKLRCFARHALLYTI